MARGSDRILLILLSLAYVAYRVYCSKILHVHPKLLFTAFVRKIVPKRKFLLRSPGNTSVLFYCRAGHEMDNLILGKYEEQVRLVFLPDTHDTIVDVGAHLGEYTIPCARRASTVIAIEPNPDVLSILKENIHLNRVSNVITVNKAVYDSQGYQSLNLFADRTGMSSVVMDPHQENTKTIKVAADTLDNILTDLQINKVNWIKIDVEGAEEQVIRGAKRVIRSNLKNVRLIVECHTDDSMMKVVEMLVRDFDLVCEQLDSHHIFAYNR